RPSIKMGTILRWLTDPTIPHMICCSRVDLNGLHRRQSGEIFAFKISAFLKQSFSSQFSRTIISLMTKI
ncbi:MAG: hypothetical protein K2W93_18420, partial [Burkholderiaceae bacterium]|nr:hypothetical protein [Burkholderiaceae bacterium]